MTREGFHTIQIVYLVEVSNDATDTQVNQMVDNGADELARRRRNTPMVGKTDADWYPVAP